MLGTMEAIVYNLTLLGYWLYW